MLKSSVQHKILQSISDDRPITAIQIVENLEKCPRGFYPISRTYDQDQDADLRDSSIFKIGSSRYLCLSKSEGLPNFVVQEIFILPDKFNPPKGFSLLNRTADSEQKAWKKKQLFYRLASLKDTKLAITDIIVCSRLKKAPDGFKLAGELNGVTVCFKMGNVQDSQQATSPQDNTNGRTAPHVPPRPFQPTSGGGGSPLYPPLGDGEQDYVILKPGPPAGPSRPAPRPPVVHQNSTLSASQSYGLDGVPFIINPKFINSKTADLFQFPVIKSKSMQQIMKEYEYSFTIERQT